MKVCITLLAAFADTIANLAMIAIVLSICSVTIPAAFLTFLYIATPLTIACYMFSRFKGW